MMLYISLLYRFIPYLCINSKFNYGMKCRSMNIFRVTSNTMAPNGRNNLCSILRNMICPCQQFTLLLIDNLVLNKYSL